MPFLGTEFMPKLDEGSLLIETRRLPSTSLPQGMAIAKEVERTLLQFPEVQSIVTKMGRPELATETMGLYAGDVYVNFKPRAEWTTSPDELIEKMDAALKQIPGIDYNFTAPMAMRLDEAISGVRTELGVKVFGDDLAVLEPKAAEIRDVIEKVPGAADTSVDVSAGAMQVEVTMDRPALARLGLNVADVREAVESGIGGTEATQIDRRPQALRRGRAAVRTASRHPGGDHPAADRRRRAPACRSRRSRRSASSKGPELINHENGERMVIVQSNVRGRDLGGFAADVQREVGA